MRFSNDSGANDAQALIAIGEVNRPHGLRGQVKVKALTDWPERFKDLQTVRALRQGRLEHELHIEHVIVQENALTIKFRGIDDRDAAQTLTGVTLAVPRNEVMQLPAGEFYTFEIIGLKVVNPQGREIGALVDIIPYPANDVWMIRKGDKELLIPATQDFIKRIDPAAGLIVVDRIEEFEE